MSSWNLFCRNELQRGISDQMGLLPLAVEGHHPLCPGKHALPPLGNCAQIASVGLFTCGGVRVHVCIYPVTYRRVHMCVDARMCASGVCGPVCGFLCVPLCGAGASMWEPVPLRV